MSYEVSEDEIKQIANSFLLASPPGEFMEVVTDVRGLLADDSIINDTAPATFREWNTDQMLQVKSPAGNHEVLISKFGEVNDSEYLDPRGGVVVQFDHIRQQVVGSRNISGELDQSIESYRSAFDAAAAQYVSEHYQNGATTIYGSKQGGDTVIRSAFLLPNSILTTSGTVAGDPFGPAPSRVLVPSSCKETSRLTFTTTRRVTFS